MMAFHLIFVAVLLRCAVQSYAWGKIGNKSTVAQLTQSNPSFKLDDNKPYSEVSDFLKIYKMCMLFL